MALRQRIQTWTSSFWLTRREFFRALRPGSVLYLGERSRHQGGAEAVGEGSGCPHPHPDSRLPLSHRIKGGR